MAHERTAKPFSCAVAGVYGSEIGYSGRTVATWRNDLTQAAAG